MKDDEVVTDTTALDYWKRRAQEAETKNKQYLLHKQITYAEFKNSRDDAERLADLFAHDLARPSSTNGELALARAVKWLINELDALRSRPETPAMFPLQVRGDKAFRPGDPHEIPWEIAHIAYASYVFKYGPEQSMERLAARGGFSIGEMDMLFPGWRTLIGVAGENQSLRYEIGQLRRRLGES